MTLEELNALQSEQAKVELTKCCGSSMWVEHLIGKRPFDSVTKLLDDAKRVWFACSRQDWLEAFSHHPKIGDISSLEQKYANTKEWAGEEQEGVATARRETLEKLAKLNRKYEDKYGYIFIVDATGKTAEEMLEIIELRMKNNPYDEIRIAVGEQNKITQLRLKKLLS